jgi:plasmid stabilization system protein ParE
MSRRLVVSSDATRDLTNLWLYRARSSISSADKLLERIKEKFELLRRNPEIGQVGTFLRREGRVFSVEHCAILYLVNEEELTIVRVVQGGQAVAIQFRDPLPEDES